MKNYLIEKNENFIGRELEQKRLQEIAAQPGSKIIIVYGRRRVGKTELLEQVFKDRNLLKFEGQENLPEDQQIAFVMQQLSQYSQEPLLGKVQVANWTEALQYIAEKTHCGQWTIYFEEVQWLADYQPYFISALKYVWDNFFRRNSDVILILCGSSPAFMINQVIKSRALYNRSQYEIPLKEFNLLETQAMLSRYSQQEVLGAYLSIGGIPEYLLRLRDKTSIYLKLCQESFLLGAFFAREYEKIFSSSLAENKHYQRIIAFLSKHKYVTRSEISQHLKLKSGGGLTELLQDLEVCGFIEKYTPYNLSSHSLLARYCISDSYLQFYFKFINPIAKAIDQGDFSNNPTRALNMNNYQIWLGFAFERFCRKYHRVIAHVLGFSAVKYRSGTYFSRRSVQENPGFQIDLLFDRDDRVITVCEIKYTQTSIPAKVIDEFSRKLELLPNPQHKTIHRVLITNGGIDTSLQNRAYFDRIITLSDFFSPHNWQ